MKITNKAHHNLEKKSVNFIKVFEVGKELSKERRRVARELRDHIVSEIQNLQMKDANLEISFKPLDEPNQKV